jgi:hypothetical protein
MEVPVIGVAAKPEVNEKFFLLHIFEGQYIYFKAFIAQISKYMAGVTSSHLFCFLISSSFFFFFLVMKSEQPNGRPTDGSTILKWLFELY